MKMELRDVLVWAAVTHLCKRLHAIQGPHPGSAWIGSFSQDFDRDIGIAIAGTDRDHSYNHVILLCV